MDAKHSHFNRYGAPAIFVTSGMTQYIGASFAVFLFSIMSAPAVSWWRVMVAAAIIIPLTRPWKQGLTRYDIFVSAFFGVMMTGMNITFYEAISRLPLGPAVSLEFLGPVVLAVVTGRSWRHLIAAAFALTGVMAIGGIGINLGKEEQLIGVAYALVAGVMWAGYIAIGRRIATQRSGITSLGIGSLAGGIFFLPLAFSQIPKIAVSWEIFLLVIGVGVLSTALPYSMEQLVLKRVGADTFALMSAILPASSMLIGAILLKQIPNWGESIGLVCVSIAVAIANRRPRPKPGTPGIEAAQDYAPPG